MPRPAARPLPAAPTPDAGWQARRELPTPPRYDFAGTVGALVVGSGDPTARLAPGAFWRASRTPEGSGTMHLRRRDGHLVATGYGPGGGWLVARAEQLAGLHHEPLPEPVAQRHPVVAQLARTRAGTRLPRSGLVFQELFATVLQQKVTWQEAYRGYLGVVRHFGEPAPGPVPLLLPPDPATVAATPYWAFHRYGIEQKRADTLRRCAAVAARLEETVAMAPADASRRLRAVPGIGPWTVGELGRLAYGDPDAVSVGDFHLPHQVAYTLAGEPRADDARMLELLEPFAGWRGLVTRLVATGGARPKRRAPRRPHRNFARH
ncbi:MAG: DNA-3-methyladenine glycosylase family protein [Micromonosporaceae bacterium]